MSILTQANLATSKATVSKALRDYVNILPKIENSDIKFRKDIKIKEEFMWDDSIVRKGKF